MLNQNRLIFSKNRVFVPMNEQQKRQKIYNHEMVLLALRVEYEQNKKDC